MFISLTHLRKLALESVSNGLEVERWEIDVKGLMGECSNFNNSSYIDVEIKLFDECEEKLKKLFDKALLIFLKEEGSNSISSSSSSSRTLPVVIGDGETVDLFKLFVLVRERKGFNSVTRKGLWDSVAEQLGFDCSVSPSLRLVYSKYLNRMEKWAVEKTRNLNWDDSETRKKGCLGGLLHELGDSFKGLLANGESAKRSRDMAFGCNRIDESQRPTKRLRESSSHEDDVEDVEKSCVDLSDDDSVCGEEEEEEEEEDEQSLDLSTENQESLPGMLKWLTLVATSPHDPSIGVIPQLAKWKEYTGNQRWMQVVRAKNALLVQRDNTEVKYRDSHVLGQHVMHPSMYEGNRSTAGRQRFSMRRQLSSKPQGSAANKCRELVVAVAPKNLKADSNAIQVRKKPNFPRRYVGVGRRYQAQVDVWTEGSGLESDTKWLGTCVWPLGNEEGLDMVGKGRPDSCSCDIKLAGSVECTRFHIADKRMELKRDIGKVFFQWRFNKMGEELSLRWTEIEEKRFKEMMLSDTYSFWKNAVKRFRGRKREELVSYYFNVFLINKRRYQNRVTPRHIDSDDDEEAFGCVGSSFGRRAVTSFDSDTMICSRNNQCEVLD